MSTGIAWTDETWNPVVGCTKKSQGCKNCYAKTLHDMRHKTFLAGKLQNIPQYAHPFETVQVMKDRFDAPLHWRKPRMVFVNSMSDLFHEDIPDAVLDTLFAVMAQAWWHTFQILTKRADRMRAYFSERDSHLAMTRQFVNFRNYSAPVGPWPLPNVWLGVSTEDQATANERIPFLLKTPAAVRFISAEPLLGPIDLRAICNPVAWPHHCLSHGVIRDDGVRGLDWVIIGGESGNGARACDLGWLRGLVSQCADADVSCFVKQLGSNAITLDTRRMPLPLPLRDRQGGNIEEWPADLRVREFPTVAA